MGLDRVLSQLEIVGDGFAIIPFGFTANGTAGSASNPDGLIGKTLASVVRSEAGEFLCTLADNTKPYTCYYGAAGVSNTADDVDMYGLVDWSNVSSSGTTFVVRTMTGATQTDPTDDMRVGGYLLVKKDSR